MNVGQLIERLRKLDPQAAVYVYSGEEGAPLRFLRTDGDELYFKSASAHRPGESHLYLCDYMGGQ